MHIPKRPEGDSTQPGKFGFVGGTEWLKSLRQLSQLWNAAIALERTPEELHPLSEALSVNGGDYRLTLSTRGNGS